PCCINRDFPRPRRRMYSSAAFAHPGAEAWPQDHSPAEAVTTLRVALSEQLRIDAPIPVPAALTPGSQASLAGSSEAVPLELERKLLDEPLTNHVHNYFQAMELSSYQDKGIQQFTEMGFSRCQAALGIAYSQAMHLGQSEVADFADNFSKLGSLPSSRERFRLAHVAGALSMCKNRVDDASELCMNLPAEVRLAR
ncbi:hypothetical protein QJQ45_020586, partial [Haematococcus lacustris]